VTEHELVRSNVLVQALGAMERSSISNLYAPITPDAVRAAMPRSRRRSETSSRSSSASFTTTLGGEHARRHPRFRAEPCDRSTRSPSSPRRRARRST
jgi:hypothetical protein